MPTVRTTVSLPVDIYEAVRAESFARRISFGEVIAHRFGNTKPRTIKQKSPVKDMAFFDAVARSGRAIHLAQTLREERNRQNG